MITIVRTDSQDRALNADLFAAELKTREGVTGGTAGVIVNCTKMAAGV